jgi:hypothetical protein
MEKVLILGRTLLIANDHHRAHLSKLSSGEVKPEIEQPNRGNLAYR